MARKTTPLTATQILQAKPKEKEYSLLDGDGLALRIKPNGSKFGSLTITVQLLVNEQTSGTLLFVKLIRPDFVEQLTYFSQIKINMQVIRDPSRFDTVPELSSSLVNEPFSTRRARVVNDLAGKPIMLLEIQHLNSTPPPFFNAPLLLMLTIFALSPFLFQWIVSIKVISPVTRGLSHITKMIHEGNLVPYGGRTNIAEFQAVTDNFNRLVNILTRQQKELELLTLKDELTGISNRRAFEKHLSMSWAMTYLSRLPLAVVMVDIDYFKQYNDTLGHQAGDVAIQSVATALSNSIVRTEDMVARYGGEEFVVVLLNIDERDVQEVMERLLNSIAELAIPHPASKVLPNLSISLGAAISAQSHCPSSQVLLERADAALYKAKAQGRNASTVWRA